MSSYASKLNSKGLLIQPPSYAIGGLQYEAITGSLAYGTSSDASDIDLYGFCIPPKGTVFPHLNGEIQGFGTQSPKFEQYQKHHIKYNDSEKEFDLTIFSIVKFFHLCMDNNPNMVDVLFVPERCVTYTTEIGTMVRDARRDFLHKGAWHRFKGYAYAQLKKAKNKKPDSGERKKLVDEHGYDTKFASHIVRLLGEVEQILEEGDLDLERNREQVKSVKRGEWSLEQLEEYFEKKESSLEQLYLDSQLPKYPDEEKLKSLLLSCLEHHYGSLDDAIKRPDNSFKAVKEIKEVLRRHHL